MKVALVLPPHSFEERYNKAIAKAAGTFPPLGILYIGAVLEKAGHKVIVLDGSMKDIFEINEAIYKFEPDIIAVNVMTFLWDKVKTWTMDMKAKYPKVFIAAGGHHVTQIKEKALIECDSIDAILLGEAEFAMDNLANALEKGKELAGMTGIITRNKDGKIISGPPAPRLENLDEIPFPARHLLNIHDYVPALEQYRRLPVTNMITTRGCPYKCIFCSSGNTKAYYRSPQNVLEEIKVLVNKYGIKDITFWDDTFTLNKKRVLELMELIKKEKLDLIWCCNSRVNTLDRELLKEMSEAGCWKIFFGVESMNQKQLNTLKKGVLAPQIHAAIKGCKEFGIESECSFIFGIPGETYQEGLQTIEEIKKLDPDYAKFFPMTPLPGTEFDSIAASTGTIVDNDLSKRTENQMVYVPNTMKAEELQSLLKIAYKKFYFRPTYVAKRVLKLRSIEDIKKAWKGVRAVASI
ncbi:MAG: radical SAM protein [Nanoarchaeota archaeon]